MQPLVAERLDQVAELCRRYHVRRLDLFGSAATGRFDPARSDLDFVVEFEPAPETRWRAYFDLQSELQALFGREVDLITHAAMKNPYLIESVNESRVPLYSDGEAATAEGQSVELPEASEGSAMPARESLKELWDAARAAEAIISFTRGKSFEQYQTDELLRPDVERQFETIGEAFNRLLRRDPETAGRIPELRPIIGVRNVLAHGYNTIDDEQVWRFVQSDVPPLLDLLKGLLSET